LHLSVVRRVEVLSILAFPTTVRLVACVGVLPANIGVEVRVRRVFSADDRNLIGIRESWIPPV